MKENVISFWCRKIVRVTGILLVGYLFLQGLFTICCIQRIEEKTYYIKNNVATQLLGIVLFIMLVWLLSRERIQGFLAKFGKYILAALFVFVIIFWIIWISWTQFYYIGDMEYIFAAAEGLLSGDYSAWQPGGYLYMWRHQNGLMLFIALLRKFFSLGETFLIFYGFNIFFYAVTLITIILSLKMMYPEKGKSCLQSIMLLAYFPYGCYSTFMYGNMIGFGFACLSIFLVLCYKRKRNMVMLIGAAIAMGLAVCFKQNELIIFIGVWGILLFDCLNMPKSRWKNIAYAFLYAVIVFLCTQIPDLLVRQITGLEDLGGNTKWAHIAMGVQESEEAPGWYNCYNRDVFVENHYDKGATAEAAKASFRESMSDFAEDPASGWKFFNYKLASEWNNPTFECFHIQNFRGTALELNSLVKSTINDGGKINILLIYLLDIGQSVLLFGILMYLIMAKDADWEQLLFAVLFIGAFVFFTFWEAKCQYVIPFFFLLIPYAYLGYAEIVKQVSKNARNWNKIYTTLIVLGILVAFIALSDAQWVKDSFKIHVGTEAYYEYIHQYNQNFMGLRF